MNVKERIAYEMHKPARKNFQRRRVKLLRPNDLLQADLIDLKNFSRENQGYKYILTVIDCFSKKAWAVPLKGKSTAETTKAMESVIPENVKNLQTDEGKEFFSKAFKKFTDSRNINHYHTFTHIKAGICERLIRTLKTWMWREFSIQGNYKWLDILPKLMEKYNNKVHRSIGMAPNQVNSKNKSKVYRNLTSNYIQHVKKKFKVGDFVRISKFKKVFDKGYTPNWTGELFTIAEVKKTKPVTYILKDEDGEIIKGGFYTEELQKTKYKDMFLVEKIVQKRGNLRRVKWLGFPSSKNTWVDEKHIT